MAVSKISTHQECKISFSLTRKELGSKCSHCYEILAVSELRLVPFYTLKGVDRIFWRKTVLDCIWLVFSALNVKVRANCNGGGV